MLNLIFLLDHDDHDSHFHSFSGSLLPWGPTFGHASVVQPVNLWVCLLMGTTWAMKNIYRISLGLIANCGWILLSGGFLESIHVYKPTYSNINYKHLQAIEIPLSASAGAMRGRHGARHGVSAGWSQRFGSTVTTSQRADEDPGDIWSPGPLLHRMNHSIYPQEIPIIPPQKKVDCRKAKFES